MTITMIGHRAGFHSLLPRALRSDRRETFSRKPAEIEAIKRLERFSLAQDRSADQNATLVETKKKGHRLGLLAMEVR